MKLINLLLFGIFLIASSCSKDESENDPTLKEILIGSWIEILPCDSCDVFTFSENDTIYWKFKSYNSVYRMFYQTISNDSIQVTRDWDIEQYKKTTKHIIIFSSSDTITIKQFMPVDIGITGFEDIKLARTK